MSTSPDPDIHDVFQQLYDQEDWAEDTESPSGPDLEVIETSLVTTTGPFKPYDTKRLLALMASLDSTGDAGPSRCRLFSSSTSKKTGHLASSPMPDLPPPSTYAPFSPLPLLARLRTYQPSTFSPFHPTVLSPVHLALNGWINDGRESLRCGACRAGWSVAGLLEINDLAMRTEVAKRLAQSANDRHDRSCAWRVTSSPPELVDTLRALLHPLSKAALSTLAGALERQCLRDDVGVDYTGPLHQPHLEPTTLIHSTDTFTTSPLALALAVFGWSPFHPNVPDSARGLISDPATTTDIIHCRICQRRIGLWSFHASAPREKSKILDILNEHRSWCPIRYQEDPGRSPWWTSLSMREKRTVDLAVKRDWIKLSDKLVRKPWRR